MSGKTTNDVRVISLVSTKGGVGKTSFAVNMACELAPQHNIVLVDCDIYNSGATAWLENASNCTDIGEGAINYVDAVLGSSSVNMELATIKGPKGNFYFVPSFAFVGKRDDLEKRNRVDALTLKEHEDHLSTFLDSLAHQKKVDFILLDCHPGSVIPTVACCKLSSCNLLITDYSRATFEASVLFAWQIEEKYSIDTLLWRFVVNRKPSVGLEKEGVIASARKKMLDAITHCKKRKPEFRKQWPRIKKYISDDFHWPLTVAPDLEEFRIEDIEDKEPLSERRRGGNGFILSVLGMLRKMWKQNLLGSNMCGYCFCRDTDEVQKAFDERLPVEYYTWRGVGRTGLQSWMFLLSVCSVPLFVSYLSFYFSVYPGPSLRQPFAIPVFESLLLFYVIWSFVYILALLRKSRRQFDTFVTILNLEQNTRISQHASYHKGGSPAATTSVWWPRFVWFLGFIPAASFVFAKWILVDGYLPWVQKTLLGLISISAISYLVARVAAFTVLSSFFGDLMKDASHFFWCAWYALKKRLYK